MLDVEFAQRSDPGRVRGHNEDYIGSVAPSTESEARSHGWLFALADGVGGQARGEVASRAAVENVLAGFRAARPGELLPALLSRLVQQANAHVFEVGMAAGPAGANMATTLVACALRFEHAVVAHAGDSRCYLIRKGHATVLTRDHTSAQGRHLLTRSLGTQISVNVDISVHQVFPGDVLMLCSDGLHGAVHAGDIARMVTPGRDLDLAARDLVAMANANGGSDNISVVAARVRAVERVGMYRGRPYKLR